MNGKKQEKFRQRAVALRRVSIVLLVFGLVKCKFKDFSEILRKILQSKVHTFTIDGKYLMLNGMKEGLLLGEVLKTGFYDEAPVRP